MQKMKPIKQKNKLLQNTQKKTDSTYAVPEEVHTSTYYKP